MNNGHRALTVRELEVLTHVARGCNTDEIARVMVVSSHTVRTHVRNCLEKLGARTRAHAVAVALGQELIEPPPPPGRG